MGGPLTVFELVGLPGAGKTTLARGLLARLAAEGRACGERDLNARRGIARARHLTRLAGFTLARGRYFPSTLRLAAAVKPPRVTRIRMAGKLAVWPYRLSVARAQGYEAVVLDQGVLQSAWTVLLEGSLTREDLLREAIEDVLAGCGATFAFISVDLDVAQAAARVHARDAMYAPFDRSEQETLHLLSLHAEQLERVVAAGVRATGAPHLRVDGSSPLAENTSRIDAFVDSVLGSAVPR
jgi:predicted kinase